MRSVQRAVGVFVVGFVAMTAVGLGTADAASVGSSGPRVGGLAGAEGELRRATADLLRAQAALAEAMAQARKLHAETLKMLEERRSMALDNDAKQAETFYNKRRMREQYLAEHARTRPSRESIVRRSNATKPQRPAGCHVDSVAGTIYWPETLCGDEFEPYRTRLEALFAGRTLEDAGPGSDFYRQVQNLTGQMGTALKGLIRQMSPGEYMGAKRFIEGLAYESRFLPEIEGIAAG